MFKDIFCLTLEDIREENNHDSFGKEHPNKKRCSNLRNIIPSCVDRNKKASKQGKEGAHDKHESALFLKLVHNFAQNIPVRNNTNSHHQKVDSKGL